MDSPSLLARFPYLCALYSESPAIEEPKPREPPKIDAFKPRQPLKVDTSKPLSFPPCRVQKKRKHKRTIAIFEDPEAKKSRSTSASLNCSDGRVPLSSRVDSANSTPIPTPRRPDMQLPAWTADSFDHEDKENIDPAPTPPPTPYVSTVYRMRPVGPPPPPSPRPIINPSIFVTYTIPLREPRNMVLYDILGLADWNATTIQVLAAWRQAALRVHPDQHAEEGREAATREMQQLNAAKEVLTDMMRRAAYHRTGELPFGV